MNVEKVKVFRIAKNMTYIDCPFFSKKWIYGPGADLWKYPEYLNIRRLFNPILSRISTKAGRIINDIIILVTRVSRQGDLQPSSTGANMG